MVDTCLSSRQLRRWMLLLLIVRGVREDETGWLRRRGRHLHRGLIVFAVEPPWFPFRPSSRR